LQSKRVTPTDRVNGIISYAASSLLKTFRTRGKNKQKRKDDWAKTMREAIKQASRQEKDQQ